MLGGIKWSILYRQALIQKSNAEYSRGNRSVPKNVDHIDHIDQFIS
jgi:hypothetical protein